MAFFAGCFLIFFTVVFFCTAWGITFVQHGCLSQNAAPGHLIPLPCPNTQVLLLICRAILIQPFWTTGTSKPFSVWASVWVNLQWLNLAQGRLPKEKGGRASSPCYFPVTLLAQLPLLFSIPALQAGSGPHGISVSLQLVSDRAQLRPCGGCAVCIGFWELGWWVAERSGAAWLWRLHTLSSAMSTQEGDWDPAAQATLSLSLPTALVLWARLGLALPGDLCHRSLAPCGRGKLLAAFCHKQQGPAWALCPIIGDG